MGGVDQLYGDAGSDQLELGAGQVVAGSIFDGGADTDTALLRAHGGVSTLDLRGSSLISLEIFQFEEALGGGAGSFTVQADASQIASSGVSQLTFLHNPGPSGSINFELFLSTATTLDLSGISVSGFTESDGIAITGDGDGETIIGSSESDHIAGNGGDDVIEGGLGGDVLDGGAGTNDTLSYEHSSGGVTVDLSGANLRQSIRRRRGRRHDLKLRERHGLRT